jgi:hypothetical protein
MEYSTQTMTQEQLSVMESLIAYNLYPLHLSKKKDFNDEWTKEFDLLFWESRDVAIFSIEDFLLRPKISINPLYKKFKPEEEYIRQEIKNLVSEGFKKFKKENS